MNSANWYEQLNESAWKDCDQSIKENKSVTILFEHGILAVETTDSTLPTVQAYVVEKSRRKSKKPNFDM